MPAPDPSSSPDPGTDPGPQVDPEARERVATLDGAAGDEAQFSAVLARTEELIRQYFSEHELIPGDGTVIVGGVQPLISTDD